jgi:hypothetical protein
MHSLPQKLSRSSCDMMQSYGMTCYGFRLLELSKCSYRHIHFDFDPDGNATPRLGPVGPPITIPDNQTNATIIILSKSVANPHKTLGHYKAPRGNSATQLSVLKTKSNKLGKQVATRSL